MLKEMLSYRSVQIVLALLVSIGISGVLYWSHAPAWEFRETQACPYQTATPSCPYQD